MTIGLTKTHSTTLSAHFEKRNFELERSSFRSKVLTGGHYMSYNGVKRRILRNEILRGNLQLRSACKEFYLAKHESSLKIFPKRKQHADITIEDLLQAKIVLLKERHLMWHIVL